MYIHGEGFIGIPSKEQIFSKVDAITHKSVHEYRVA